MTAESTSVYVPADGRPDARLVIIGEAPGAHEVASDPPRPLIGPAGYRLSEWMTAVGLARTDAWIDNVYPYRAPRDKLDLVGYTDLDPWMRDLYARLAALTNPYVIVPLGNYPLYALLGLGVVSWHKKDGKSDRKGITAHRGSIYKYRDLGGRTIKVIPTIHPSATLRQPALEGVCRRDWEKIAADLQYRDVALPTRHILSEPRVADVEGFIARAAATPTAPMAFDIERPAGSTMVKGKPTKAFPQGKPARKKDYRAGKIVCISFSLDAYRDTIVIPFQDSYWRRYSYSSAEAWAAVAKLLTLTNPKVTQNGLYDYWHLADYGIAPVNWAYDTLYLHHALNARDRHSLEFLCSVDLRTQYYKDESKDPESLSGWTEQEGKLRHYCGKDSSHTLELLTHYLPRFDAASWQRYLDHYWHLYHPLLALMRHGLQVDSPTATQRRAKLLAELSMLRSGLKAATGANLMATKALSTVKLKEYLYRTLKLPEQYKGRGRAKTVTTDEVAIKRLASTYPDRFPTDVSQALLRTRRVLKLSEAYDPKHFDEDGRMRSTYSPNTQQGRLSSKKNPRGSGTNGQNIDRSARDVFLADPGKVMVIVDLSQAESRVNRAYIYSLTGDPDTYHKATAAPGTWDDHSAMAGRIFDTDDPDDIKRLRPLGKMIVHASQRKMQGDTLADRILKVRGEVVLPEVADGLIKRAIAAQPGLLDYFQWVDWQVMTTRAVTSCWGVPLRFTYDRLGPDIYREAYSFLMQDWVGRLTNQYGMRWLWEEEPTKAWQSGTLALNAQWHDGLLMSFPPDAAFISDTIAGLCQSLARPRLANGVELSMPSEVKIGVDTAGALEWASSPTESQVADALSTIAIPTHERSTP